ncbi:LysE family translocator [Paraglaciecola sp. 2405UD69-4]|uniref:LysE family translocator n=1 Tax=Paraglaciecola sp. 2405UD69-4 TaxID=3391836 RepID=UPI0039C98F8B
MTYEIFSALLLFTLVSSATPGPNNLMLMTSGANYGFKRTLPHLLGVNLGFMFMVVLVGLGLTKLFDAYPVIYNILKVVSVAYLLYLAFKIATSDPTMASNKGESKPMSFIQAVIFQWVNPKAWTMALMAISVYAPSNNVEAVLFVTMVFGMVNLPCITVWTILGKNIRRFLTNSKRLRVFNCLMASMLVVSLYPMFL